MEPIKLHDFKFEVDGSECQIDCLLLFQNQCLLIEVKNLKGSYIMQEEGMYLYPGNVRLNTQPFVQLDRAKSMLETLFRREKINLRINGKVVFTHPEFFLYHANPKLNAVYMPTFNVFINEINKMNDTLTSYHYDIIEKLSTLRLMSSSFSRVIEYEYSLLDKGMFCTRCNGRMKKISAKYVSCSRCKTIEQAGLAIIRSVREFKLLFPSHKITVSRIFEWIDGEDSKFKIRTALSEIGRQVGTRKSAYYEID